MAASPSDQLRDAIDQQAQLVTAAEDALYRAERAVSQARTPSAAVDAHRRADAALIEVELAEAKLRGLTCQRTARADLSTPRKRQARPIVVDQAKLFDVG